MAKYVNADKLIEAAARYKSVRNPLCNMKDIYHIIQDTPPADVAPVASGEWFGTVCSVCGNSVSFYYDCDYCPRCGAKMEVGCDD